MAQIKKAQWKATYQKGEVKFYCEWCWSGLTKHKIDQINFVSDNPPDCDECRQRATASQPAA